jgi:hypothetical protein
MLSFVQVLVVLTGGSSQAKPTEVIGFSFKQSKWFSLAPLPYDPGMEFSECTYANNIYLSGREVIHVLIYTVPLTK